MKIVLAGEVPSKKNSRVIVCRGSKPILLPSSRYKEWHDDQMWVLKGKKRVPGTVSVEIRFYPKTRRKSDLTNKAESIMDLLVDSGILEDDNWFVCRRVALEFIEVDSENPHVEILLTQNDDGKKSKGGR